MSQRFTGNFTVLLPATLPLWVKIIRFNKDCLISPQECIMLQVLSYQIADSIDIKAFKAVFKADPYYSDSDELFYQTEEDQFIYVFKYGVVCFLNYDAINVSSFLKFIAPYTKNPYEQTLSEEFLIETGASATRIGFNKIEIMSADVEVLRLIMLNVSQSGSD